MSGAPITAALTRGIVFRLRAAGIHLGASLVVALLTAAVVLGVWYPYPHSEISGGRELFALVTSVDVVLGPLITLLVFDLSKGRSALARDLSVVALLQAAALAYGVYTTMEARPVAVVFEVDRFRVISANMVLERELPQAAPAYRRLPLRGPWLLSTRPATPEEMVESVSLALAGYDTAQRPIFWQPFDQARAAVLQRRRPLQELLARYPGAAADIQQRLRERYGADVPLEGLGFLPLVARRGFWVVLLTGKGDITAYAPYDGFF